MGAARLHGVVLSLLLLCLACAGQSEPDSPREPRRTVLATEYDDERAGVRGSHEVESEVGLLDDPELVAYVDGIARKLVRFAPRRSFEYRFSIVDQFEPNAFALPGGQIYVSRGLLALVSSEDELANVLGHEIIHSAARHAAARQAAAVRQNPFAMPYMRVAALAAYERDQESDADRGGQSLAARAGYDPEGMATFLRKLENVERLRIGHSRIPRFFDTHPGTVTRAADCAARAQGLSWRREAGRVDRHLDHIEGIELGTRPSEGVFDGSLFMHPELGFQIRFPDGWSVANTNHAVGAAAPGGRAMAFLALEGPARDPREGAEAFIARHGAQMRLRVLRSSPVQIGEIPAWRLEAVGLVEGRSVLGVLTFVPHAGYLYRITAIAAVGVAQAYVGRARSVARSFAPLSEEARASIRRTKIEIVEARPGEDLVALGRRTDNAFGPQRTAILNGAFVDIRFAGGERIKIVRSEAYQ
jgi:predicted Zn-dependent protease